MLLLNTDRNRAEQNRAGDDFFADPHVGNEVPHDMVGAGARRFGGIIGHPIPANRDNDNNLNGKSSFCNIVKED